jgi:hypothetical protein
LGRNSAFEGVKMKIAVSAGITVERFRIGHTGSDCIFGYFLIIGPFFLFFFTGHTYGLVVIDRKDPQIVLIQRFFAARTGYGTLKLFFPLV